MSQAFVNVPCARKNICQSFLGAHSPTQFTIRPNAENCVHMFRACESRESVNVVSGNFLPNAGNDKPFPAQCGHAGRRAYRRTVANSYIMLTHAASLFEHQPSTNENGRKIWCRDKIIFSFPCRFKWYGEVSFSPTNQQVCRLPPVQFSQVIELAEEPVAKFLPGDFGSPMVYFYK